MSPILAKGKTADRGAGPSPQEGETNTGGPGPKACVSGWWPLSVTAAARELEGRAHGRASASHWASTQPGGWGWERPRGTRRMAAEAEAQGCRSWHPLAGAGGQAGAQPGHRVGTLCWWQGPGGGWCLHLHSPKARPTASSWRVVSGARAAALALMVRGSSCRGCGGPALSLRR